MKKLMESFSRYYLWFLSTKLPSKA